jgi:hypothetical protein
MFLGFKTKLNKFVKLPTLQQEYRAENLCSVSEIAQG